MENTKGFFVSVRRSDPAVAIDSVETKIASKTVPSAQERYADHEICLKGLLCPCAASQSASWVECSIAAPITDTPPNHRYDTHKA